MSTEQDGPDAHPNQIIAGIRGKFSNDELKMMVVLRRQVQRGLRGETNGVIEARFTPRQRHRMEFAKWLVEHDRVTDKMSREIKSAL